MTDKEKAIAHLVLMDASSIKDVATLKEHWNACFDDMVMAEHRGDCTKHSHPSEEAVFMAPVYRELFGLAQ